MGLSNAAGLTSITDPPPSGSAIFMRRVDFSIANNDTPIDVDLPAGFPRFLMAAVRMSNPSGALTACTVAGLFTAPGGGGTNLITASVAVTINTAADGTTGNCQTIAGNNSVTRAFDATLTPTLYFRTGNAQSAPAFVDVVIALSPVL